MNICTSEQMLQAERELIESGTSALSLMEEAAVGIARSIIASFPNPSHCVAYLGKGNNAGDALAVLRILSHNGWRVAAKFACPVSEMSDLAQQQYRQFDPPLRVITGTPSPSGGRQLLLIDGLLGLGAKLPLSPEMQALCDEMNEIRITSGLVRTWSIDIPTGVDADTGEISPGGAVTADFTSIIGAVKKGLVEDTATAHVGRIVPVSLPGLRINQPENAFLLESKIFSRLLRPRPYEMYKNQAGHVGVIAGSPGMLGAAKLCSEAALRAGAGLVTLYALEDSYPILAAMVSPEIMVKPVKSYDEIKMDKHDTLLIGPGLGELSKHVSISVGLLIKNFPGPVILDADGLALVVTEKIYLRENILATPHPGEMSRFLPPSVQNRSRAEIVEYFTSKHSAAVLYKGARTIISQEGSPIYYNATGGPAMATAGQGDVLAGVCAGLCAQGITPLMSGCLGAHICGIASEIEISSGRQIERTLTSGDTLKAIPAAMKIVTQGIL